jgi:hypothetical protein
MTTLEKILELKHANEPFSIFLADGCSFWILGGGGERYASFPSAKCRNVGRYMKRISLVLFLIAGRPWPVQEKNWTQSPFGECNGLTRLSGHIRAQGANRARPRTPLITCSDQLGKPHVKEVLYYSDSSFFHAEFFYWRGSAAG